MAFSLRSCLLALLFCALAGCSSSRPYVAFSDLSDSEREWVIPDLDDWADGDICLNGGSCSGALTAEWFQETRWTQVDPSTAEWVADGETAQVSIAITHPEPADKLISFRLWDLKHAERIPDIEDRNLEMWVGFPHGINDGTILLFDQNGRIGALGRSTAKFAAEPLLKITTKNDADSPLAVFSSLRSITPPVRVLTAADPGLTTEVVTGSRMRKTRTCISYGKEGPTLIFPTDTVRSRTGRNSGIEVLEGWSGLSSLPFKAKANELELVVQRTTIDDLDVDAYVTCNKTALFVVEIRTRD